MRYVAFLRGINVGGNTLVSMEQLKRVFATLSFTSVETVLASGNVVFDGPKTDLRRLTLRIEEKLHREFGHEIAVLLRTSEELLSLLKAQPFKKIKVTAQTRLNVSFLPDQPKRASTLPQQLMGTGFQIERISEREVCSALEASPGHGTSGLMRILEKEFGKRITTRTWNTIERIGRLLC
jgi:uncharacterized protein (DUF1697 family)